LEDKFNVNFVLIIQILFSRNITQLIGTQLPQCRSNDEAKKCQKLKKNPPNVTQSKSVACSQDIKVNHSINFFCVILGCFWDGEIISGRVQSTIQHISQMQSVNMRWHVSWIKWVNKVIFLTCLATLHWRWPMLYLWLGSLYSFGIKPEIWLFLYTTRVKAFNLHLSSHES